MKSDGSVRPLLPAKQFTLSVPRKLIKAYLEQFMWLQWFNLNVMKWWEYFLCAKKQNNDFIQQYLVMADFKTDFIASWSFEALQIFCF